MELTEELINKYQQQIVELQEEIEDLKELSEMDDDEIDELFDPIVEILVGKGITIEQIEANYQLFADLSGKFCFDPIQVSERFIANLLTK